MQAVVHVHSRKLRGRKPLAQRAHGVQQGQRIGAAAVRNDDTSHRRQPREGLGEGRRREGAAWGVRGPRVHFTARACGSAQNARRVSPVDWRIFDAISSIELPLVSMKRTPSRLKMDSASATSLRHRLSDA